MRNAELQGGSDPRGPPPCTTRARSIPHSAFRIPHSGFHVTIPNLVERAVDGRFGPYGGRYVPETLMAALERSEEHTSELQSHSDLVCRLLLEKKKKKTKKNT